MATRVAESWLKDFLPTSAVPNTAATVLDRCARTAATSKSADENLQGYEGQLGDTRADSIQKGMFRNHTKKNGTNPTADPRNWLIAHNVVVGGQDHQHPHCDLGKVGSFAVEEVFPFVAVHGFGVNEFQMWLLPMKKKRDYVKLVSSYISLQK